ncbi:MAG: hypothetical protein SO116_00585 [Treponema sp.]|nr:hypothetical protein [Treponema sp.]
MALSVACIIKGDIPSDEIFFIMEKSGLMKESFNLMADLAELKNPVTQAALTP